MSSYVRMLVVSKESLNLLILVPQNEKSAFKSFVHDVTGIQAPVPFVLLERENISKDDQILSTSFEFHRMKVYFRDLILVIIFFFAISLNKLDIQYRKSQYGMTAFEINLTFLITWLQTKERVAYTISKCALASYPFPGLTLSKGLHKSIFFHRSYCST